MTNPPHGSGDGNTPDLNKAPKAPSYGDDAATSHANPPTQPGYGQAEVGGYGQGEIGGYGQAEVGGFGQGDYGVPPAGYVPGYGAPEKPKGLAIASLVCGIVSIVLSCFPLLGLLLGVVAVVTGVMGGKKARAGLADGAEMAKAGLITGIIGIVFSVVLFALAIILYVRT